MNSLIFLGVSFIIAGLILHRTLGAAKWSQYLAVGSSARGWISILNGSISNPIPLREKQLIMRWHVPVHRHLLWRAGDLSPNYMALIQVPLDAIGMLSAPDLTTGRQVFQGSSLVEVPGSQPLLLSVLPKSGVLALEIDQGILTRDGYDLIVVVPLHFMVTTTTDEAEMARIFASIPTLLQQVEASIGEALRKWLSERDFAKARQATDELTTYVNDSQLKLCEQSAAELTHVVRFEVGRVLLNPLADTEQAHLAIAALLNRIDAERARLEGVRAGWEHRVTGDWASIHGHLSVCYRRLLETVPKVISDQAARLARTLPQHDDHTVLSDLCSQAFAAGRLALNHATKNHAKLTTKAGELFRSLTHSNRNEE